MPEKTKVTQNNNGFFEATIGGHKYEFSKWGAGKSLDVLTDLATLLGEPLADVIANVTINGPREAEINETQMATVIRLLFIAIKENKDMVLGTIRDLVGGEGVFVDGKAFPKFANFDDHYSDLGHMFEVVPAALEVQYGSFFAGMGTGAGLSLLKGLAQARRKSPSTGETPTT